MGLSHAKAPSTIDWFGGGEGGAFEILEVWMGRGEGGYHKGQAGGTNQSQTESFCSL